MSLEQTTAVALVGGLGTRLRSVLADQPKCLAPIAGRPFLTFVLDQLVRSGIRTVVLCTGYHGRCVQETLGAQYGPLQLEYSHETTPLGTGGGLRHALPYCRSDPVLVVNGDSYCETDVAKLYQQHCSTSARATLVLTSVENVSRYGAVDCDDDGRILQFIEKRARQTAGWINGGIYLLNRSVLAAIPAQTPVSLERDLFPQWIGDGVYGYKTSGRFVDIGTPASYVHAEHFFCAV